MANQTHKTIIFEEFDANYPNNLFLIFNSNLTGDNLVRKIDDLTVKTFDEFMHKFAPKVYEITAKNPETGSIKFFYTTDPKRFPNCSAKPMDISEHAFYKMLSKLYSTRGASGKATLHFDDKDILEILTPKKEIDDVHDIRQEMEFNMRLFYEAKARGDRNDKAAAKNRLLECKDKIAKYANSSVNKLLPILIEDTNRKLELLGAGEPSGKDNSGKAIPQLDYGVLYLNEKGQIDLDTSRRTPALAAPKDSSSDNTALVVQGDNLPAQVTTLPALPQKAESTIPDNQTIQNKIAEAIMKDYDEKATNPNEKTRSLILSTFAPLSTLNSDAENKSKLDVTALTVLRKTFEDIYTNAIKSFAVEMSRIVESLLGVKTFFDHATADGGEYSEVPGGVIIANCKVSKLLKIKDKLAGYMKHLGKDQTGDARIWFAVVPSVLEKPPKKIALEVDDDDDNPFGGNGTADSVLSAEEYVSIEDIKSFLEVMNNAKIMTVFNVRVDNDNTFADLSGAEIEKKIKEFSPCNYAHAAYAYPNFTLIRERDYQPFPEHSNTNITLPGIFTDAAYPAAGLLVASQQTKVLDNRKLRYDKDSPCVSIDFENVQVKKKLMTKFNRESVLRRSEDLIKVINENMFGFAFSGDEVEDEGGIWKNSYVHCARTLAKNKKGSYKPVYQTLTEDYIYQNFLRLPSKKKPDVEEMLIKKINNEYAEKNAQNRYKDSVNLLLREGEYLRLENDGGKEKIIAHFVGGDSYIEADVESD